MAPPGHRKDEKIPSVDVSGVEKILIAQGAEAKVWEGTFGGVRCILKERFRKEYRHPTLDGNIRKQRTRKEVKALQDLEAAGVRVPHVIGVDWNSFTIVEEKIPGLTLKEELIRLQEEKTDGGVSLEAIKVCGIVGDIIAKMHDLNIVHGDLTSSNFIVTRKTDAPEKAEVAVIDLGLASTSTKAEDKAVDLYVLEKALEATHPNAQSLFSGILNAYEELAPGKRGEIINRFKVVRLRGRKRTDKE